MGERGDWEASLPRLARPMIQIKAGADTDPL